MGERQFWSVRPRRDGRCLVSKACNFLWRARLYHHSHFCWMESLWFCFRLLFSFLFALVAQSASFYWGIICSLFSSLMINLSCVYSVLVYLFFLLVGLAFFPDSGCLFTCGDGTFGQLGHGDYRSHSSPVKVSSFVNKNVHQIACGMRHSLVLLKGKCICIICFVTGCQYYPHYTWRRCLNGVLLYPLYALCDIILSQTRKTRFIHYQKIENKE